MDLNNIIPLIYFLKAHTKSTSHINNFINKHSFFQLVAINCFFLFIFLSYNAFNGILPSLHFSRLPSPSPYLLVFHFPSEKCRNMATGHDIKRYNSTRHRPSYYHWSGQSSRKKKGSMTRQIVRDNPILIIRSP